ncbi:MAG: hypothetical protein FWF95_08365 [Syntrophorhabdaceae bacterium]|nr:hypothetical protein [Syntrophorhabdaceae bacterium]
MTDQSSLNHQTGERRRVLSLDRQKLIVLLLLFIITVPMLTKIFTSDFGTHLAVGREIVQNRHIPIKEIWNYPSLGMSNGIGGEWGFMATLYLVYSAGGEYGVSIMIWAIVLSIFLLLYKATILRGGHPLLTILSIFAFSGFLRIRVQPRPEIFTYLFIALTIYLLSEYYFGQRKKAVWLFLPLILVWANCHPTYLIAFGLCGAFFVDALMRAVRRREFRWEKLKEWVFPPIFAGVFGLILCGLNPHGYGWLFAPLHLISRGAGTSASDVLISISELLPVNVTGMYIYYKAAAGFALVSLALGLVGRRVYLLDLILFSIAFKGSWSSARAVSMMGLFLSSGAAIQLTGFASVVNEWLEKRLTSEAKAETKAKKEKAKPRELVKGPDSSHVSGSSWRESSVFGAIALALALFGATTLSFSMRQIEYGVGITKHKFSFQAVEFLRKNPVPGRMINFFDIGGFLDWQLYPGEFTFIDGRAFDNKVFDDHQKIMSASAEWELIVEKYDATYMVLKSLSSSGEILPIIQALAAHPNWALVFTDGIFIVFVRNVPETSEYIKKHWIDKGVIPKHIIDEAFHCGFLGVSPVRTCHTQVSMYLVMGRRNKAIEVLGKCVEETGNQFLMEWLIKLKQLK